MNKTLIAVFFIFLSAFLFAEEYPPKGWNSNFLDAVQQAEEEDKYLLLNFTGSDWCIWCSRLKEQVFSTQKFKDWADENAVLVFLDFPSSIELSENQTIQNAYLQQFLGVEGYPSIWLFDSQLDPLLITGYRDGGVDSYLKHLSEDRVDIPQDQRDQLKQAFTGFISTYLEPLEL